MIWSPIFLLFFVTFAVGNNTPEINFFECPFRPDIEATAESYRAIVKNIVMEATHGKYAGKLYDTLNTFFDKFGSRVAGSKNLEDALDHIAIMAEDESVDSFMEPVSVPYWIRGKESATLLSPRKKDLLILGLVFSPRTIDEGITADVIVVSNFEELEKKKGEIPGKIVLFNGVYTTFEETDVYRKDGPARASSLGAVAALVRSVTPFSIYSPHTGTVNFGNTQPIPSACVTIEDADMMARMYKAGEKITVNLKMDSKLEPEQASHNFIFDLPGTTEGEYVALTGNIDSLDVGEGVLSNGAGAFLALYSVFLLKSLKLPPPKRTVRGIMWTGGELGHLGAHAYAEKHKDELKNWTAVLEGNSGFYSPIGFNFNGTKDAHCMLKQILPLFQPLDVMVVQGSSLMENSNEVFYPHKVPMLNNYNGENRGVWFHHTNGDTMRTQNSADLDKYLALYAAMSYILADMPLQLDRTNVFPINPDGLLTASICPEPRAFSSPPTLPAKRAFSSPPIFPAKRAFSSPPIFPAKRAFSSPPIFPAKRAFLSPTQG